MSEKLRVALNAGYEQCEPSHPDAQLIDGLWYRPKLDKDSLWNVLQAIDCDNPRRRFGINVCEA